MTFKALRNVSLAPWRIGRIVAAALVLLHFAEAIAAGDSTPARSAMATHLKQARQRLG
jgi:hypothetical protein